MCCRQSDMKFVFLQSRMESIWVLHSIGTDSDLDDST